MFTFELLSVGAIFFAATIIQTITGFAGNLLAMPAPYKSWAWLMPR